MNVILCPECGEKIPENSRYCNMCGIKIEDKNKLITLQKMNGEIPLIKKEITTPVGAKSIQVICQDITEYPDIIDVLTISSSAMSHSPVPGTVIEALESKKGIIVEDLLEYPLLSLQGMINCWISEDLEFDSKNTNIRYIGCIEKAPYEERLYLDDSEEESILRALKAYFNMLMLAADMGVKMDTVAMPIIGTGSLSMEKDLIVYPLVNEAINALINNDAIKNIIFIERNYNKASLLTDCIEKSYQLNTLQTSDYIFHKKNDIHVFISYSTTGDINIAKRMYELLKERGIDSWFAPNDIRHGDYASKIVEGIEKSTHFICIISKNSLQSEHVLNEVDLAFSQLKSGMQILPFRLDDAELNSSFKYYLSRMQWNNGNPPPVDERINEFLDKIFGKI